MKKVLWFVLLMLSILSIGYFVVYPIYQQKTASGSEDTKILNESDVMDTFVKEGWDKPEVFHYVARDIPSLEKEFYELNYPPFLYTASESGEISKSSEVSHHENGMVVTLYMDDNYFLKNATLEYTVSKERFGSESMNSNIEPFYDFIKIITGKMVSDTDKGNLLREFAKVFNETENINHSIVINDLKFTLTIDKFYLSINISC